MPHVHGMKLFYVTFPSTEQQERVADTVVEERLAACIVSTPVSSLYIWEEEKTRENEVAALFKTSNAKSEELVDRLEELHPYDVPCILELPVTANLAYDEWVHETV